MGFFKSLGKVVGGVGDVVKKAAPLASFIPGVGPAIAAGVGASGALLGKLNDHHVTLGNTLGSVAGGAAWGGLGGYGIDKLQGFASGPGGLLGKAQAALTGRAGRVAPPPPIAAGGGGGAGNVLGAIASAAGGGGGGGIFDFLKSNPELIMAALGMVQNARQQSAANNLRRDAVTTARQPYTDMAPLRDMAVKRLGAMPQIDPSMFLAHGGAYDAPRVAA